MASRSFDVAIVGGGPGGSTAGTLLKKYRPDLKVAIFEQAAFPRDHIGESQLPAITSILSEMGVWDKVEAAGFPVKLGGTYRWGSTNDLWYLNFIPPEEFVLEHRPAPLTGQRLQTAFQVDRSIFDKVLLDHAESVGCQVFHQTKIGEVGHKNGTVTKLHAIPSEGNEFDVNAEFYIDASGERGLLRRALGIGTDIPTTLRNIAFWDYWQGADWAESVGGEATRIQIMSLGWGWMWFIPISSTRTSIGLVMPADYYKKTGKKPEDLYMEAVKSEPLIADRTRDATREGRFSATKDWNFVADQLAGDNWFLVGDSCGFADPILSAGMTLAHTSGKKAAYSILELFRKRYPKAWVQYQYSESHRVQIMRHMRFAEFWYAGNGQFTDLKSYCSVIADSAGLKMNPDDAFYWLGTGGFAVDDPGMARAATFPISGVKHMTKQMAGGKVAYSLAGSNVVSFLMDGAEQTTFAYYLEGQIRSIPCLVRGEARLPIVNAFGLLVHVLKTRMTIDELVSQCTAEAQRRGAFADEILSSHFAQVLLEALEGLVLDGWVKAECDDSLPPSEMVRLGERIESR